MMNRTVSSRGRTNDPEGLRRKVLDVAYAAFTTRGYHSTALQDLKQEAGVSGGAFSHHFPTKKDLGLAVLRDRVAGVVEEAWIRPVLSAATAAEGVQTAFAGIIAELETRRAVAGCPVNNLALELSGHDADFRAQIDAIFGRWRQAIADKMRDDMNAGAVYRLDPDSFATFIVAAYSGAMALAKAGQSAEPLKVCAEHLAEIIRERHAG